ncbi:LysM peptidoglycan-binding domain-containing protein [Lentiprolixibacter aurantiacus]|uniref:LysM peptidoglycan-binding domain-containing protein n=1 Tax=Lentiprolixibacter aurantiacus TaxID=2993939 RepID=A0AAE3MM66_9FLAO|nr:LysM peptidoglycan-binding domain-containing protein [Lentiprolixibacter aurantiacus]MCX2720003.1 LysM peptidoglycan-binding domain-containing protein [Lentiprolixibacter aurantiacus]
MNSRYRKFFLVFIFLIVSSWAWAQQFATHAVKEGETLGSIAKQYKVTPFNILKVNPEIKSPGDVKPNIILVIPLQVSKSATAADTMAKATGRTASELLRALEKDTVEVVLEPSGFRPHRVRKGETLYGIANRYEISEQDLKRFNPDLYSQQLKRGMRLRIPIFPPVVEDPNAPDPENYEVYRVLPKETRWSIAHKYGITIDSLVALNPDLPKTTNHLAIGQELLLPRIAGTTVEGQDVQLFESYTVPPQKTLYSITREYDITYDELIKLNPEIVEHNGLKEGMVLRLPVKKAAGEEVNTDNYVFYEVKPKQTEFSLTRMFGISYTELLELNPELAKGLKAGMVLKLPTEINPDLEVKNSLVLDKINLLDSINLSNRPRILFMLPFRLDRLNLNDKEAVSLSIERSNALKYSLGLYSGALVALDSIASLGISVDVKTYDTQLDLERSREIATRENLSQYAAIFGPLQNEALKEVAAQALNYQVPVIAPLASQADISLGNVFFTVPTEETLRERMLTYMQGKVTDQNIVVIADQQNKDAEARILEEFPGAKVVELVEEEENISLDLELFTLSLSIETDNWVFVETDNFKVVSSVSSILNSSISDTTQVRMFTTNKNKAFENEVISGNHLSNLRFTYPSIDRESGNTAFVRRYRRRFGSYPDRYAIRGFDLTFDMLLKLAYKMNLYEASEIIGVTEYDGNKFDFAKDLSSGYYNTALYIMMYDEMRVKQVNPLDDL